MYKLYAYLFFTLTVITGIFVLFDITGVFEVGIFWVFFLLGFFLYISFAVYIFVTHFFKIREDGFLPSLGRKIAVKYAPIAQHGQLLKSSFAVFFVTFLIFTACYTGVRALSFMSTGVFLNEVDDDGLGAIITANTLRIDDIAKAVESIDSKLTDNIKNQFFVNNLEQYEYTGSTNTVYRLDLAETRETASGDFDYLYNYLQCKQPAPEIGSTVDCIYPLQVGSVTGMFRLGQNDIIEDFNIEEISIPGIPQPVILVRITTNLRTLALITYPSTITPDSLYTYVNSESLHGTTRDIKLEVQSVSQDGLVLKQTETVLNTTGENASYENLITLKPASSGEVEVEFRYAGY